jgi:hypothetical protein
MHNPFGNFHSRTSASAVNTGEWVHVAAVLAGGGGPAFPADPTDTTPRTVMIGRRTSGHPSEQFAGLIDEVLLFDRALSAGEIAALADRDGPRETGRGARVCYDPPMPRISPSAIARETSVS